MHLNILQGLQRLRFEGVGRLDVPIGAGLYLSTRGEIVSQVVEGKITPDNVKMPTGTGTPYPAHLYTFNVRLPEGGDKPFPQHLLESFSTRSQLFLETLWLVKDNSGNAGSLYGVRIGPAPLQCSLPHSVVHSDATCKKTESIFVLEELNEAIAYFHQLLLLMPKEEAKSDGPPPMALRHPSRLGRALYLTQGARGTSEVGIKTAMYCIAFECLFSTVVDGTSKCVAERGSHFLEDEAIARRSTCNHFKRLYKYRSKVVHGSAITPKHETKLRGTAVNADNNLRRALRKILASPDLTELFSTDDPARLNAYFNDEFSGS